VTSDTAGNWIHGETLLDFSGRAAARFFVAVIGMIVVADILGAIIGKKRTRHIAIILVDGVIIYH
jgi:hypothetical protein